MTDTHHNLLALRSEIDAIDQKLVELLNQRASISIKIGHVKTSNPAGAIDIKDDLREKSILLNITEHNTGPLRNTQLTELFECIMSHSRDLQGMHS